jgi:1,4-dihydroxy-2-naphthoate octaprenyltransferase
MTASLPTDRNDDPEKHPPSKLKAIFLLPRVQFTIASFLPFAIGTWWVQSEGGVIDPSIAIIGLVAVLLCNMAANVLNEYYDRETDRLVRPTHFSGGSGMIGAGVLSPTFVLRYAVILAAGALSLAVVLQFVLGTGPWTVPIILLGIFIGWAYSARPLRLVARGVGELTVALTVAILVPLTGYYIQTGTVTSSLLLVCLPLLPFIFLVMLSVHFPDYEGDVMAHKTNLVVRLGIDPVKRLFLAALILPYLLIIMLSLAGLFEVGQLILLASLPLAILLAIKIMGLRLADDRSPVVVSILTVLLATAVGLLEISYVLLTG